MSSLTVKLGLNTAAFSSGLKSAGTMASGFGRGLAAAGSQLMAIAAPVAGLVTAGAALAGVKSALDFGGEMSDLSAKTGIAVKDLVILSKAFENAGMDASQVGPAVNKLQKALTGVNEDGEPTNKTFAKLGMNMEALRAMAPQDQLAAVGKAISGISDPAQRSAAAMGIFGKSGGDMLALFSDPDAIATATQQVGAQAEILGRNAAVMDKISDAFGSVKTTLRGFFVGLVEPLLPLLTRVGDWLNKIAGSAVAFGQKLGGFIANAAALIENGFKTGTLGETVSLMLQVGFGEAVNYLGGLLNGLASGASAYFGSLFKAENIQPLLSSILVFPELLLGGLLMVASRFTAAIQGGISMAIQAMMNALPAPLRKLLTGSADKGTKTLEQFTAESKATGLGAAQAEMGQTMIGNAMDKVKDYGKVLGDAAGAGVKGLMQGDFSPAKIMDTAEARAKLGAKLGEVATSTTQAQPTTPGTPGVFGGGGGGEGAKGEGPGIRSVSATDQFAKVGLFSGGQSAFADASRKTADNTGMLVKLFERPLKIENPIAVAA